MLARIYRNLQDGNYIEIRVLEDYHDFLKAVLAEKWEAELLALEKGEVSSDEFGLFLVSDPHRELTKSSWTLALLEADRSRQPLNILLRFKSDDERSSHRSSHRHHHHHHSSSLSGSRSRHRHRSAADRSSSRSTSSHRHQYPDFGMAALSAPSSPRMQARGVSPDPQYSAYEQAASLYTRPPHQRRVSANNSYQTPDSYYPPVEEYGPRPYQDYPSQDRVPQSDLEPAHPLHHYMRAPSPNVAFSTSSDPRLIGRRDVLGREMIGPSAQFPAGHPPASAAESLQTVSNLGRFYDRILVGK